MKTMETLNIYKLWQLCEIIYKKQIELEENNIYISLLGTHSNYNEMSYEYFLEYYNFKIEENAVIVFNCDKESYSDYSNDDYNVIPTILLEMNAKDLKSWLEKQIQKEILKQKQEKDNEKIYLTNEIKRLQEQLNTLSK
jgi:hypothetical protein